MSMRCSRLVVLAFATGCTSHALADKKPARMYSEVQAASAPAMALDQPVNFDAARQDSAATHMLIRTGEASIEVDSVDRAVAQVRELAKSAGGYVGASSIERGDDNARTATLAMDVPEDRFDHVLGALTPIGRVESVSVNAQDVGEEYVDVQAREANAKRLEERLIALLATRTGKLKDVLDVERELARVRGEIEHDEGHLRYLKSHAAMSTLEVTVHEHRAVLADAPGEHPIREAVHKAWTNFVGFVAMAIASLGILLPAAAIAVGAWLFGRRLVRRRPREAGGAA